MEDNCQRVVEQTVTELGGLDVLVNNVATQEPVEDLGKLSTRQWERTFRVNVHSYFWTTRAALEHLPDAGSSALIRGFSSTISLKYLDWAMRAPVSAVPCTVTGTGPAWTR